MSQHTSGYPAASATGSPSGQPTTQVARDEAADVGRTAAEAGRQVAGTAAEQAANVAQEVKTQARDLVGEARGQVRQQARTGQDKAADGIRMLSGELREMAGNGQRSGPVSEVARQAADRADRVADWLGEREPEDLLEEVRRFARRRPGAFILGSLVAGVVVGRLTRGAVDAARGDSGPAQPAYGRGYAPPPAAPLPYEAPVLPRYGAPGTPLGGRPSVGAVPPVPSEVPTPPEGYAPTPAASPSPLPPAPPGPARGLDPLAEPTGRHTPGAAGEYGDEIDPVTGEPLRRNPLEDPYRPGDLR